MHKIFEIITYAHAQVGPITQLPAGGAGGLNALIMQLVDWILYLGGGIGVLYVVYGGFMYLTAGSNEEQTKNARSSILHAIIGIIIIAFALVIVDWTGKILNLSGSI